MPPKSHYNNAKTPKQREGLPYLCMEACFPVGYESGCSDLLSFLPCFGSRIVESLGLIYVGLLVFVLYRGFFMFVYG
jgi:hypothetical protein